MKILTIIPARGGSKGIPSKNIRFIAGKPLLAYAIECAGNSAYDMDIVVSSDEEAILKIAEKFNAETISRPSYLAGDQVTLDPVICHATVGMEEYHHCKYDIVITMQPTSPLLSTKTLDSAICSFMENKCDTLISGVNDPRLSWHVENGKYVPNYEERMNRQYMPKELKETGAFVITKRCYVTPESRFGENIAVYEVPEEEAGDIDTVRDWLAAKYELNRKKILIRLEGYPEIGLGHVYRGLLLAENLMEHDVSFVISQKSEIGIEKLRQSNYPYHVIASDQEFFSLLEVCHADIIINDILNTDTVYMQRLKEYGARVVNFEDLGEGRHIADAVVNALYEKDEDANNIFWGDRYYLIRNEFLLVEPKTVDETVREILVIFGGTDPDNLTQKTVQALMGLSEQDHIHVTVILGMGYKRVEELRRQISGHEERFDIVQDVKFMPEYMSRADIAVSSQGRTMLELATMQVPTIIMAQNDREVDHEFGSLKNGFLNLGLGRQTEMETIRETVQWLIYCPQIRQNMRNQMAVKNLRHGIDRVKPIILGENVD